MTAYSDDMVLCIKGKLYGLVKHSRVRGTGENISRARKKLKH